MKLMFIHRILSLFVLTQILSQAAYAQWPLYRVYSSSGMVNMAKAASSKLLPITKSAFLYEGDKLVLAENAEVILFNKNGDYIKLARKGNYSTAELGSMVKMHLKDNITLKYSAVIWEDLFKSEPDKGAVRLEEVANSTGGVSRGATGLISPAVSLSTSMNEILFRWRRSAAAKSYSFVLTDDDNKVLFSKTLNDTVLLLRLKDSLVYGDTYYWAVKSCCGGADQGRAINGQFQYVNETETLPKVNLVILDSLDGVIHDLQIAQHYQNAGCTQKAYELYREMDRKYPGDPAVKILFKRFKVLNGLGIDSSGEGR